MIPDFNNTEIAFAGKTDRELKRAALIFKLVAKPTLVKFGNWFINAALKLGVPFSFIVKPTFFKHFCGGESIAECENVINKLASAGCGTILDFSAEGIHDNKWFDKVADEIIQVIRYAEGKDDLPFAVFKMTGIAPSCLLEKISAGIELSYEELPEMENVNRRLEKIFSVAEECAVPVMIDAEETHLQQAVDEIAEQLMLQHNSGKTMVYTTLQMYRTDRLEYLESLLNRMKSAGRYIGVKLVRGAYMEKERERAEEFKYPSPIHKDKDATDKSFDDAVAFCVANINLISICLGSHNEESAYKLVSLMKRYNIQTGDTRVCFSQLLGMSDHITFNLSKAGYNVAKYVPYGSVDKVMPYLIRRAEENTSVAGQSGRELSLLKIELRRRRHNKKLT